MRLITFFTLFACVLLCANAQFANHQDIGDGILGKVKDLIEQDIYDETTTVDDEVFTYSFIKMIQHAFLFPD